ncbi:MAG: molybdenum ABC transporter ATP-binding protein [Porticoccaceae bacterium]|jgi:molybdate transport system ATP-binding protein|nr:molybdenum ABC transporter ATP-binding protein [Porticoccaceae bacterium]MDB2566364.1 molybdenum ABC transporter ATP-binding protein [Porticoccaceae bacterium]MDB2620725.1 molybdenum ABC transporter ATP-binding protein [Porticoccaceae bacterium]MDG1243572.1 molybdenum ABC transporter ATP-binding protein [Porticoccaceae bacterium]MDG1322220.1 molybdenum ABC transporter ATP-binding protein [Porticoccaceae bacterium]
MSIEVRFGIKRGEFSLTIDTEIPEHGVTAIFGASGSGKTTLLRAIAGLEAPENGYLKVGGVVWQDTNTFLPTHERKIGYVFQEPSLFQHLNVQDNINYGLARSKRDNTERSLDEAISLLGIEHLLKRMPWQLSGGEQQRVAIVRALVTDPSMLLLDEPLAALGDEQKAEILPYLESVYQQLDIPVLYVSHSRNEVARLADHILLLNKGTITAYGKVTDIFTSLDLPLAHQAHAETIIDTTVISYDAEFGLATLKFSGGQFVVASNPLESQTNVRLQILARDVSVTLEHQKDTSILNIFPVTIDHLVKESSSQMTLRLLAGKTPLLARVTCRSAQSLNLKIGDMVYAQVKTVALLR